MQGNSGYTGASSSTAQIVGVGPAVDEALDEFQGGGFAVFGTHADLDCDRHGAANSVHAPHHLVEFPLRV